MVDYTTGATVEDLSLFLNSYGADGWQLVTVDLAASTTRRRHGGGLDLPTARDTPVRPPPLNSMHNAEDIWLALSRPLPSFADLVRSYAPLVRGYPEFDPDEPRDESGR